MNGPFFNFIKPALDYLDSGRFFREPMSWLYTILAICNLLLPLVVLGLAIEENLFRNQGKFILGFLLIWVLILGAAWVGFQIWWDRRKKVTSSSQQGDEFVASLAFAHFIQTYGEWYGTMMAIVGTGGTFIGYLIMGEQATYLFRQIPILNMANSWLMVLIWPIAGYLIVVAFRFVAELIRALGAIANHTRPQVSPVRTSEADSSYQAEEL
jgi:hypothetical protein